MKEPTLDTVIRKDFSKQLTLKLRPQGEIEPATGSRKSIPRRGNCMHEDPQAGEASEVKGTERCPGRLKRLQSKEGVTSQESTGSHMSEAEILFSVQWEAIIGFKKKDLMI